ncbi:MAG: DUF4179 domain-containing protein [Clostridium sp.]|uniref:DUF4179 domain-containing protein n=1 Tax=Clostridium sp. TaxID=1506 RepID=UPI003F3A5D7C
MGDNIKDKIKIPTDLDNYILKGMEEGKEILKEEKKKQNRKKLPKIAIVALIVTSSTAIIKPEIVSAIPVVGKVFEYFKDDYKEYPMKKYQELGAVIGQTIDKNGNKVTLDQIVLDNNVFVASVIVEANKLNEIWAIKESTKIRNHMNEEIKINGTEIICNTSVKLLNDNKAMVIISSDVSNLKLDDEVKIDILLNSLSNIDNREIKGPWEFNVKATKKIQSKERVINEKLNLEVGEMVVEKADISPISTKLYISGKYKGGAEDRDRIDLLKYTIKDDKGNNLEISFGECRTNLNGTYELQIDVISDLTNAESIKLEVKEDEGKNNNKDDITIKLK